MSDTKSVPSLANMWCEGSHFSSHLYRIVEAQSKKEKDSLIMQSWPEFLYLILELAKQLKSANCALQQKAENVTKLQKKLIELELQNKKFADDMNHVTAEILQYKDMDRQKSELISSLKESLGHVTNELSDCKETNMALEQQCKNLYSANITLKQALHAHTQSYQHSQERQEIKASNEGVKYWGGSAASAALSNSHPKLPLLKPERVKQSVKVSESEVDVTNPSDEVELSSSGESSLPILKSISPRKHFSRVSSRGEEKFPKPVYDTTKVIKFLKGIVGHFTKKGSACIISHLETYEKAMMSLNLNDDKLKIEFVPWVFEPKHRHFFNSLGDIGVSTWADVVSEIKSEFGPYRSAIGAKKAMFALKCRPNQSPREFLSVLRNAYSLAERNPDFDSPEFIQLFYDALPNKIKMILARDYRPNRTLDWLLKESTTLYAVLENSEESYERFNKPTKIAETNFKEDHTQFESQRRSSAEVVKNSPALSQSNGKSNPSHNKVTQAEHTHKENFGKKQFYKNRRIKGRNYRKLKHCQEERSDFESENSVKCPNSDSDHSDSTISARKSKRNLNDRMDEMQNQCNALAAQMSNLLQLLSVKI